MRTLLYLLLIISTHSKSQIENEKLPEYKKGGANGLIEFLFKNMRIPTYAAENCIQGVVMIRFRVLTTGQIDSIQVYNPVHDLLDKEATRLVKLTSGNWIPGKINDSIVNSFFIIATRFFVADCPNKADEYYNFGVTFFQENNYPEAIKNFESVIKLNPYDIDALYNLAVSYLKTGEQKKGCEYLNRIKYLGKSDADSLLQKYCK